MATAGEGSILWLGLFNTSMQESFGTNDCSLESWTKCLCIPSSRVGKAVTAFDGQSLHDSECYSTTFLLQFLPFVYMGSCRVLSINSMSASWSVPATNITMTILHPTQHHFNAMPKHFPSCLDVSVPSLV